MEGCVAIGFAEMCRREGVYFQRGMYFRVRPEHSVLLISGGNEASYDDKVGSDGSILIYEGHNAFRSAKNAFPQMMDQPERTASGGLTANGRFHAAAQAYREGKATPEAVRIYRKLRSGVWLDLGLFYLVDSWKESDGRRLVFKFKLRRFESAGKAAGSMPDARNIPGRVRAAVWNRDGGKCVICGSTENLHFDHILPVSLGGGSSAKNIQLLCFKHNIAKSDKI